MSRSCEKLGCNAPAEVAFGIDRVACVVWLEVYDEDQPRHLNRLCDDHAARLTLPRGWTFDDRRERSPRLFVARSATATKTTPKPVGAVKPAAKSPRKNSNRTIAMPRRTSRDASSPVKRMDGPGLFDPTLPINSPQLVPFKNEVPAPSVDIEESVPEPRYAPKFDRTSDVGGALNATGRLLRRAFSSQTKPIERPSSLGADGRATASTDTDSLPQGDHIDDFNQGDHVE